MLFAIHIQGGSRQVQERSDCGCGRWGDAQGLWSQEWWRVANSQGPHELVPLFHFNNLYPLIDEYLSPFVIILCSPLQLLLAFTSVSSIPVRFMNFSLLVSRRAPFHAMADTSSRVASIARSSLLTPTLVKSFKVLSFDSFCQRLTLWLSYYLPSLFLAPSRYI